MKQLKFMMVALTLLMGLSLTSCLNSDDTSDNTRQGLFRVKGYMGMNYFEDTAGNKLYPTSASLTSVESSSSFKMSSTNLAYIQYRMVETEASTKAETTPESYNITLSAAAALDGLTPIMAENTAEMESTVPENAPIVTIGMENTAFNVPFLYDKETLFLPIVFRQANNESVVEQHKMRLVCNREEIEAGDTELVLYLRHDRGTDEKTDVMNYAYQGFNITEIVNEFTNITGGEPAKVTLSVKETGTYATEMPAASTTYSADFKPATTLIKNN